MRALAPEGSGRLLGTRRSTRRNSNEVWRDAGGGMTRSKMRGFEWLRRGMLVSLVVSAALSAAQEHMQPPAAESSQDAVSASVHELQEQVRELQAAVAGMRSDWQRARAETTELRRELQEIRATTVPPNAVLRDTVVKAETGNSEGAAETLQNGTQEQTAQELSEIQKDDQKKSDHAASLEEEYQLLSGKVDDQYQTKVESASKYRVRLSGIVLMNLVSNQGQVDSIDLPTLAFARQPGESGGSFGATLRQSEIGLEVFGPTLAGAKTRADLQVDLAGGFPPVPNGTESGLMRLRTATMRMDWPNTSVVVGQDAIFFSPNTPTSFATLAIPALTYSGNLWSWVPQIRIEHRVALGEESSLLFQGGILDPVSGEAPGTVPGAAPGTNYYRQAGPGEASRHPAYGTRIAWTRNVFGQPLRVGVGGYYSRQDYGFGRDVDGWAA